MAPPENAFLARAVAGTAEADLLSRRLAGEIMMSMRLTLTLATLSMASGLLLAQTNTDPCSLLTAAQVSAALGVTVQTGKPAGGGMCYWSPTGQLIAPKRVMLQTVGKIGTLTPADRFNTMKSPVPRITKTPVAGVGDDALYIDNGRSVEIAVKKGAAVFQITVFGFPPDQIKSIEKSLALEALGKV
jgi:hypothetical protein